MGAYPTVTVALAGALGVLARALVQRMVPRPGLIPWGTFLVNVGGALAAGFLVAILARRGAVPLWVQETVFVGFLGGFTTFSALSTETFLLLETRHYGAAAAYSLGSLAAGLAAVFAGILIGRGVT